MLTTLYTLTEVSKTKTVSILVVVVCQYSGLWIKSSHMLLPDVN